MTTSPMTLSPLAPVHCRSCATTEHLSSVARVCVGCFRRCIWIGVKIDIDTHRLGELCDTEGATEYPLTQNNYGTQRGNSMTRAKVQ